MDYTGLYYGKKYQLVEPPIASGGEGKILAVRGEPDKLAKVYHNPEKAEQDKLRYMVLETQGVYGNFISRMIAWPLDVLVGNSDRIHGFTMPRFPGVRKLSEILPDQEVDWGKRVVIAWNLCDIVQDVEKMNQCIGDMNPSNFGVDLKNGHVYAFDADSFHFRASNGRLYPCYVGIAEYYAPELQRQITRGQDMRTLNPEHTFSRNTDRFALAVLIFQLLFNGYHPFSARRLEHYGSSTVVNRQATNILNKVCAYFNPQKGTGIPRDAPPIDIVPPKMQQMFKRAFLTEDRPSATEWQGALTELSRSLKTCNNQHSYYTGLPECPWCKGTKAGIDTTEKSEDSQSGNGIAPGKEKAKAGEPIWKKIERNGVPVSFILSRLLLIEVLFAVMSYVAFADEVEFSVNAIEDFFVSKFDVWYLFVFGGPLLILFCWCLKLAKGIFWGCILTFIGCCLLIFGFWFSVWGMLIFPHYDSSSVWALITGVCIISSLFIVPWISALFLSLVSCSTREEAREVIRVFLKFKK